MPIVLKLLSYWRYVLVAIASAALTYKLTSLVPDSTIVPEPAKEIKAVEKVLKKKTSNTVIKKPDGTVITKSTTSDTAKDSSTTEKVSPYHPSKYSLDLTTNPKDVKDIKVGGSVRIGNTPLHGVVEYEPKDKEIRAGIRAEF